MEPETVAGVLDAVAARGFTQHFMPDGRRGTLTDAFGVYAAPRVGAFMRDVELASR